MSTPRRHKAYLGDICEAIQRIAAYTAQLSQEQFLGDPKTQDAVIILKSDIRVNETGKITLVWQP